MMTSTDKPITPSTIIHLFANAMPVGFMERAYTLRGEYVPGKGVSYQGSYYDFLKDEFTDGNITLVVPGMIRSQLEPGRVVEISGYLSRRINSNGARIELVFAATELLSLDAKTVNDEQVKAFELIQRKANAGYRDVDGFIKAAILEDRKLHIEIVIGKNAIIDSDILHQLGDATGFYDIRFIKIALTNEAELIQAIRNSQSDILAVSRGGGEKMEIFDQLTVAEAAIDLHPYFVTAIGHQQDTPLLQKLADKSFITPTAFGQYLNDMYNRTIEEKSRSKGRAVEEATRQLRVLYDKELQNKDEALRLSREALTSQQALHEKELRLVRETVKETVIIKRKPSVLLMIVLVILSLAAGIIIAMLFLTKFIN